MEGQVSNGQDARLETVREFQATGRLYRCDPGRVCRRKSAKYAQWGGVQGRIFATQQAGTVPLKLYWSAERKDNFSTATAWGEAAAKWAGYTFVRIQGYVYPNTDSRPNTIPLRSFWGQIVGWLDNWTTTNQAVIDVLKGWGWLDTGVQAYILKPKAGHRGRAKGPKANLVAQAKKPRVNRLNRRETLRST